MKLDANAKTSCSPVGDGEGQVAKLGTGGADKATSWCVSVAVAFVLAFALQ